MQMRKKFGWILLTLSLVCLVGAAGCGKSDEADVADTFSTEDEVIEGNAADAAEPEEEEEIEEEVAPEGMYRSELTNEWISEDLKDQRPLAVMVDNEKTALPHYGLTQTDIVYEMMNSTLNDQITRFMVLVKDYDSIEQLGSIRSVRPTNLMIAPEWNAIVCHDGGPFYINSFLSNPYVDNFSGTFSRVNNGKPREFTEYVLTGDMDKNFKNNSKISRTYNEYAPTEPHFEFASESKPVDLSQSAGSIDCTFVDLPFHHNGSELEYDEASGTYLYSEYGSAHLDPGNNNQQLAFKNVILQKMSYNQLDAHGYMVWNCLATGQEGYYITNGKAIPITWSKVSDQSRTIYYDMTGDEITINTGKTYIGFVGDDVWSELVVE